MNARQRKKRLAVACPVCGSRGGIFAITLAKGRKRRYGYVCVACDMCAFGWMREVTDRANEEFTDAAAR